MTAKLGSDGETALESTGALGSRSVADFG